MILPVGDSSEISPTQIAGILSGFELVNSIEQNLLAVSPLQHFDASSSSVPIPDSGAKMTATGAAPSLDELEDLVERLQAELVELRLIYEAPKLSAKSFDRAWGNPQDAEQD